MHFALSTDPPEGAKGAQSGTESHTGFSPKAAKGACGKLCACRLLRAAPNFSTARKPAKRLPGGRRPTEQPFAAEGFSLPDFPRKVRNHSDIFVAAGVLLRWQSRKSPPRKRRGNFIRGKNAGIRYCGCASPTPMRRGACRRATVRPSSPVRRWPSKGRPRWQ